MKIKTALVKKIAMLCMVSMLAVGPVSAYVYSFSFSGSSQYLGSMNYTAKKTVSGARAYVYPNATTIKTMYFLSPYTSGSTQASNVVYIGSRGKKYFTYKSGYGGSGNSYCLAGCPDPSNGTWNAYSIGGEWTP